MQALSVDEIDPLSAFTPDDVDQHVDSPPKQKEKQSQKQSQKQS
eukprot:CAMPEP_0182503294 /NCGR_PEP_ID=MMETSP1321-20130603/15050_1 /TAXON_ID=91990 /ORGANISM="Bolidomonas sp., Strain RCC1657" /LENGTH=43 /DNA_ID= /DNA_START= /DNA_END= /DNA_ORIENTATION=